MNQLVDDLTQNISVEQHIDDVVLLTMALLPFHSAREKTYAMSFAKRGEVGVWMNLARKYDRIDNLARATFNAGDGNAGVTLVDTLVDLAMYSLKWLAVIKHVREDDLRQWVARTYCHDTGIDAEQALSMFGIDILCVMSPEEELEAEATNELQQYLDTLAFAKSAAADEQLDAIEAIKRVAQSFQDKASKSADCMGYAGVVVDI